MSDAVCIAGELNAEDMQKDLFMRIFELIIRVGM